MIPASQQHMLRSFLLFFVFLFVIPVQAGPQDKAFIWEVRNGNSAVYLMGSVHFANASFYPLRPAIQSAFDNANNLVVEVDIATVDPLQTQQLMMKLGTYQGNEDLRSNLSTATWQRLERYMQTKGMPIELFAKHKPGLLVLTLTSMELVGLGMLPDQGIDLHFMKQARGNKNILELETLEQQLKLLMDSGDADQILSQSLDEFANYGEFISILTRAWRSGNTKEMEELMIKRPLREYPESKPFFDQIFTQRNLKMTEKIKSYLDSDDSYFVVVGAGHLIGDTGIVKLLERAGFKAERL